MPENDTILVRKPSVPHFVLGSAEQLNRAAFFGDGVFETMVYSHGKIRFKEAHQDRIRAGLKILKIDGKTASSVYQLESLLQNHFGRAVSLRVRWNVYRSGLGKYSPASNAPEELLLIQPFMEAPKVKSTAYVSNEITVPPTLWSSCKTLNSLTYVMANLERQDKEMDEVILTDQNGHLCEAGAANLFWQNQDRFYSPSLECNCIAGVGRKVIIEHLRKNGLDIIEGKFRPEALLDAQKIFTTNVTGISYIKKIMGKTYSVTPIPMIEKLFV